VGVDETLGLIDFELKRLGHVTVMPLGVELGRMPVTGHTALQLAQSALKAHASAEVDAGSAPFEEPELVEMVSGLLVSRDHSVRTPSADHLPALSALLRVSRDVGAVMRGGLATVDLDKGEESTWDAAARQSVADQLRAAAARTSLTEEVVARLHEASTLLGVDVVTGAVTVARHDIGAAMAPGARICFTGTALDASGKIIERDEMERLATSAGLTPVRSVSKTRCEVLVTAEAGTQSGKARKAQEYGKAVFTAEEFFEWLAARSTSVTPRPH
jgi:ATP-dependent DNA helicase PIF1